MAAAVAGGAPALNAAWIGVPTTAGKSNPVCSTARPLMGSARNPNPDPTGPSTGAVLGIIGERNRVSNRRDSNSVKRSWWTSLAESIPARAALSCSDDGLAAMKGPPLPRARAASAGTAARVCSLYS